MEDEEKGGCYITSTMNTEMFINEIISEYQLNKKRKYILLDPRNAQGLILIPFFLSTNVKSTKI